MTSLNAHNIDKPIDPQTKDSLTHPDTGHVHGAEPVTKALYAAVDASESDADVQAGIHAPINSIFGNSFVQKWVPGLQDLAAKYHVGNYVLMRGTGEKFFESMPLYPR
jgi:phosphatidylserine decarboxylase